MVGWLIVLGLLALLLGLLLSPFSFAWDYDAPKDRFFWKLSWLGISFADSAGKGLFQREKEESQKPEKEPEKQKKKKRKKPKKSRRPAKKKSPESSEKTEKQKLEHGWALIKGSLSVLPKPLRLLWKGISLKQLTVGVQVGRFDAQECALAYGAANAAVYTAVGLLGSACGYRCSRYRCSVRSGRSAPLGRPRKAAPLFPGSSGGTVQLCRRLCDAEKPAGN